MANKSKDLLILGALGAAAAAGYFYYEKEKDQKEELVPHGNQHQIQIKNESPDKSADSCAPGTGAETKNKIEEKMK